MAGRDEPLFRGDAVEPWVERAVVKLDDPVALRADEVVVVLVAAPAVAELTRVVGEDVDDTLVGEQSERAVHGGEPEPLATGAQAGVELLRGHVVPLGEERLGDRDALPRGPDSCVAKRALDRVAAPFTCPASGRRHRASVAPRL